MRLSALIPVSMLCLVAACASSTPDATTPDPNNPCPPGQYCATPTQPSAVTTTTAPPATTSTTPATAGQATPMAAAPATPIITQVAGDEVKGMQPEGGAFAGNFTEGQTLEQPLTLAPGKCYAVVGVSLPGVSELDIKIVAQPVPQLPPAVLAQDSTTGPTAVVGGKGNCFKNALPVAVTGKVILTVSKGAGLSGAQVYVK